MAAGQRPVEEATRISIWNTLSAFQASDQQTFTFPSTQSNHDRAVVHHEAKKFGFVTKSYGKNEDRAVRVTKGRAAPAQESLFELPLGPASRDSLGAYFARHPPTEAEVQAAAGEARLGDAYGSGAAGSSDEEGGDAAPDGGGAGGAGGAGGRRRRTDRGPHAAEFSPAEVARRQARWTARQARPELAPLRAGRAALPIAQHRGEILAAMAAHQVILIAGETGCGKTTQVPQYIMEDAWSRGAGCRVICTQPRRISAISVADRVAAERGEAVGEDVGYTIRLESKGGPESSLVFCTNGVLLRMLTAPGGGGGGVARVTHLVIDEIHERDRFADFLLILVRDLLPSRPDLRVVLMSATLHVDLFSAYFGGCPVVRVPGFTHPVQDFYLEDVLRLTGYEERAVAEVERGLGGRAAAAGVVRANGGGGGGAAAAAARVPAQERAAVAAAVEAAFKVGGDAEFEALMEVTGAAGADDAGGGAPAVNVRHPASGVTALMAAAFHGREDVVHVLLGNGADPGAAANSYVDPASGARHAGLTAAQWAARRGHAGVAQLLQAHQEASADADAVSNAALSLSHYQKNQDQDEVDVGLIETLLQYICGEGPFRGAPGGARPQQAAAGEAQGAVLVFLPGWDEIIRLKEALEGSAAFGNAARYLVLPLHSQVAPAEQRRVFARTPRGARKLVLATNIAETAITIDDVVCVIDAGRLKEKSYDAYTGVSTLQTAWISKASERQRRGRAGRCQPGVAFRMYSRQRSDGLDEFQAPEIQRSPLDEMCLQVKLLEDRAAGRRVSIARFLGKAVEPPVAAAVDGALRLLEDIGALDAGERLTSLGRHLAALPLAPALGKMLLYGLLYRCLDPVLTVACFMAYRDPWILPAAPDARREASLLRAELSAAAGGSSDHLATVRAYNGWRAARASNGDRGYCGRHFLSPATMNMVDGQRRQLLAELTSLGLVTSLEAASARAADAALVRAVLGCGFYPLVGRVLPVAARDAKAKAQLLTRKNERVRIHPCSVNSKLRLEKADDEDGGGRAAPEFAALMCFDEVTRSDISLYVKSCTAVHPHPLILVAANVSVAHDPGAQGQEDEDEEEDAGMELDGDGGEDGGPAGGGAAPATALIVVDGWLKFRVPFAAVAQLMCLRLRLASAFASTVRHPRAPLPEAQQGALDVSAALFSGEAAAAGDGRAAGLGASLLGAPQAHYQGGRGWGRDGPPPGLHSRYPGQQAAPHWQQQQQQQQQPYQQQQGGYPRGGGGYQGGGAREFAGAGQPHRSGHPQRSDDPRQGGGGVKRTHSGAAAGGGRGGRGPPGGGRRGGRF